MSPIVSICCITYNHEKYIRECLESFLMQKTNFKFEILIHDDASTDGTADIIREYEQKYPDIIKPIYQTENKFTQGISISKTYNFPRVQGKYVAMCEGDDYWIDEYKLQKQVDFLESNSDYSICFHPVQVTFDGYDKQDYSYPTEEQIKNGFTFENFLKYNFIQTNSVMYRWFYSGDKIKEVFPDDILPGDWYLHLLHAKIGKIGYIDETMSVYRRNPNGIWSDTIESQGKIHQKYGLKELNFYNSVYKFITNSSDDYFSNMLIPCFKEISRWLIKYKKTDMINQTIKKYPEYFAKIISDYYLYIEDLESGLINTNKQIQELLLYTNNLEKDISLLKNIKTIFKNYYKYKILSKILFGKKRKHYKTKAKIYYEQVKMIKSIKESNNAI